MYGQLRVTCPSCHGTCRVTVKAIPRNERCTPHGRSHPKLKAPQLSGAAPLSCMNRSARAALGNITEG